MRRFPLLYGIWDAEDNNFLYKIERSFLGGVGIFQLRIKGKDKSYLFNLAKEIKKIAEFYGVMFIINDHPDICIEVDADGVHIGKEDEEISYVRKKIGNKVLGVSCYDSIERAKEAQAKGADYVSFSSPYPSPTKVDKKIVPLALLKKAKEILNIPMYVIGGINAENVSNLLKEVKCGVCSISGIYKSEDPFFNAYKIREKLLFYHEGSLTF
ncbi:MAG: thiamine phosphate synthase [Candidatus Hydrothermales bacterium]